MRPALDDGGIPPPSWDPAAAQTLLGELAFALLSPTPPRGQIVVRRADDAAPAAARELPEGSIVVVDEHGAILSFDPHAERLFGRSARDVLGKPVEGILGVDGLATNELLERAAGSDGDLAIRGRRSDGSHFPVAFRATSCLVHDHRLVVFLLEDLGGRRAREATERKAEMRQRLLIEQIPAVTFIAAMDEGSNEIYVSPQIESLVGFSQREWLENPILWFSQLHPDDRAVLNNEFARGIATGGPFRADVRVFSKDGRIVWVRGDGRLVRDQQGKPLFFQGIAVDVTDSKRAEEEIRAAQEMKLRNERLAAIGQVAASISHDLRNPLGAIRNAWYYLKRAITASALAGSDPHVPELSELIDRELARCASIIGDLLDFARYRPPSRSPCSIASVVAQAIGAVEKPSGVRVMSDIPADLPVAYLDPQHMVQVLINLVQNAIEAVDPQQGSVLVSARVETGAFVIEVADDGPGMAAEVKEKIFEPLFTTKTRGTGLGLAVVANLVRGHGGDVVVESAPGRGTTFRLWLPGDDEPSSP